MTTSPSASVPASPVVRIEISGSTVSVNGVVILHDGTQALHAVAVQAAADRVAKPLGRPVRAMATDAEGSASMIVHPDGRATDVVLLESTPEQAPAPAAAPAVAGLDPAAIPATMPSSPPPPPALRRPPMPAAAAPAGGGAPSAWPSKLVRSIALAAALVAVVGMGVLLLGSREDGSDTATDRAGDATPVAAGASDPGDSGDSGVAETSIPGQDDTPEVEVTALPGAKALRLTIESTSYPATAVVRVEPASGKSVERDVDISGSTTEVDIDRLAPGPASWTVEVPGAAAQSGQVDIAATFVAPTPTPTTAPAPAVDPGIAAAQAEAKAAKQAERAAKREARQAKQQARQQKAKQAQQQKAKQDKAKKQTKAKKKSKSRTGFGRQKKNKTGFRD